eukprot:2273868-Ditylum_brightwellii.AAC.1
MPSLQPHWCRGSNKNSDGSNSPPKHTVSSQKESEEESKNPPSQQPKRDCANYGPPSAHVVNKPRKAMGVRKMAEEDDGKEKGP